MQSKPTITTVDCCFMWLNLALIFDGWWIYVSVNRSWNICGFVWVNRSCMLVAGVCLHTEEIPAYLNKQAQSNVIYLETGLGSQCGWVLVLVLPSTVMTYSVISIFWHPLLFCLSLFTPPAQRGPVWNQTCLLSKEIPLWRDNNQLPAPVQP